MPDNLFRINKRDFPPKTIYFSSFVVSITISIKQQSNQRYKIKSATLSLRHSKSIVKMNANSNLNPKYSTKRDVPTSSSTSISVTNNSAATSPSSSIVSSAGETETNESDDKSCASPEQNEMFAAEDEAKEQTNHNLVECWSEPINKLMHEFDALTAIVDNYNSGSLLEKESHDFFSNIVEEGLEKLTSSVTFSRALQELPVGGKGISNIAVELKDAFVSANKIAMDERKLSMEKKKVPEQHKELSEQHKELLEQHQCSQSGVQDNTEDLDPQKRLSKLIKQIKIQEIHGKIQEIHGKIQEIKYGNEIKVINIKLKITEIKDSMFKKYTTIAYALRIMSNLSQSDAVTTRSYSTIQDSGFDELLEKKMIAPGEWNFFQDTKPFETAPSGFKKITNVGTLNEESYEKLKKFNTNFQNYVKSATLLKKENGNIEGFVNTFKNILQSSNEVASNYGDSTYYPDIEAEEVACVQPFLKCLLCALGNMASEADWVRTSQYRSQFSPTKSSPTKSNVQSNRIINPTDKRHKRIVDKSLSANNRYIFLFRDDCIEIPLEVKPGKRKNMSSSELIEECKNQILGHLAKHVTVGFNFMGIGIDTKATGVVITPCSVQFVQLCLENIGTPAASLAIYETGPLPLLSFENFSAWKGKESDQKAKKKAKRESADTAFGYDKEYAANDVPLGLVALANLMTMERKDLMGHSAQFECGEKKDLHGEMEDLLAWGSFSLIYKHRGKDGEKQCVKKISRYALSKVLDNEKQVLQDLNGISNIVELQDSEKVKIKIGTAFENVPSLTLAPLGLKIELYLLNLKNEKNGNCLPSALFKEMRGKLRTALKSIHAKGYVHNDISPKNIIVHDKKPILIDFGIASKIDTQIKGFRGTPHFTAKPIFRKYPGNKWTPKSDYDFCALALSMAWLVGQINQDNKTWDSFKPCTSLKNWANSRYEIARSNVTSLGDDYTEWVNDMKGEFE